MFRVRIGNWTILLLLSFLAPLSFSGEIYRWTDETGVVHFTDDISNVPARYQSQVDKREVTEEISKEAEEQIDSEISAEKANPPGNKYLEAIDQKIEEKRIIEKKISELEEEMMEAEERIKQLEKDEDENHPSMQPFYSRGRFVPVESPHYREKVKLADRIKSIKEEIATLEERLSKIRRSL